MSLWFCCSNIVLLICTHFGVGVYLPTVVSCPRYTHDCIPCYGANINAFQYYHFVSKGIVVDLPLNIKKAVALEVLTTFLEELQFESMNLCTRKWLNTILLTANDARHRVDWLLGEL
jgi:hypothetical protein